MDESELEEAFDRAALHADGGIAFWGDVLIYRASTRTADELATLNRRIYFLTVVATAATIASVATQLLD